VKRFAFAALLAGAALHACSGPARQAKGPPPEYERPVVPPWDAGKPVDPLEQALERGEAVDTPAAPADAAPSSDGEAPASGDR
jgi:hypothetical protein